MKVETEVIFVDEKEVIIQMIFQNNISIFHSEKFAAIHQYLDSEETLAEYILKIIEKKDLSLLKRALVIVDSPFFLDFPTWLRKCPTIHFTNSGFLASNSF